MRFTQEPGHFTTRYQALEEIDSVGWHAVELTQSAEENLHWHDFDAVVYVLEGTASIEYEDGTVLSASPGTRVAAPAGIVHRNIGADWLGILAFPVSPIHLIQPIDKPLPSRPR